MSETTIVLEDVKLAMLILCDPRRRLPAPRRVTGALVLLHVNHPVSGVSSFTISTRIRNIMLLEDYDNHIV